MLQKNQSNQSEIVVIAGHKKDRKTPTIKCKHGRQFCQTIIRR